MVIDLFSRAASLALRSGLFSNPTARKDPVVLLIEFVAFRLRRCHRSLLCLLIYLSLIVVPFVESNESVGKAKINWSGMDGLLDADFGKHDYDW